MPIPNTPPNQYHNYKYDLIGSWKCPYCNQHATLRHDDIAQEQKQIKNYNDGNTYFTLITIQCPNNECENMYVKFYLDKSNQPKLSEYIRTVGKLQYQDTKSWQLLPESLARIFPEYVPEAIRSDYEEASKIKDFSPKASATLARRCLQGIIRDFYEIKEGSENLFDEINRIESSEIDANTKEAFHDLREIGNIGAHMQKDVNLITDIDPDEAEILVNFIEKVIELTYVKKHYEEQLFSEIKTIKSLKVKNNRD